MAKVNDSFYQDITNKIVAAIEAGQGTYEMPWNKTGAGMELPKNVSTDAAYQGVNVLILWMQAQEKNYRSQEWATFKQWNDLGHRIKKGENGVYCVKYVNTGKKDEADGETTVGEDGKPVKIRPVIFKVFNADQVEGYEPKTRPIITLANPGERLASAETFFKNLGADIRHGGDRAFYSPGQDFIQMPEFEAFKTVEGYYSVLAHEATHWTGAKSRLDRPLKGRSSEEEYAFEELIAELGAAYTMANLGLSNNEPRSDHAGYIESWLKKLKDDPKAIFKASTKARHAASYLLDFQSAPSHTAKPANQSSLLVRVFQPVAAFSEGGTALKVTTTFGENAPAPPEKAVEPITALAKPRWSDLSISQQHAYSEAVTMRSAVRFLGVAEFEDTPGVPHVGFSDLTRFDLDKFDQSEWFPVVDEETKKIYKGCHRGDILVIEKDMRVREGQTETYIKAASRMMEPRKYQMLAVRHEGIGPYHVPTEQPAALAVETQKPKPPTQGA